jgi:hypothetical protein
MYKIYGMACCTALLTLLSCLVLCHEMTQHTYIEHHEKGHVSSSPCRNLKSLWHMKHFLSYKIYITLVFSFQKSGTEIWNPTVQNCKIIRNCRFRSLGKIPHTYIILYCIFELLIFCFQQNLHVTVQKQSIKLSIIQCCLRVNRTY